MKIIVAYIFLNATNINKTEAHMTDRPILFSAPMIRALLAGTKTQTRRALKAKPYWEEIPRDAHWRFAFGYKATKSDPPWMEATSPTSYGATQIHANTRVLARPGDRLWCRETYTTTQYDKAVYRADARDQTGARWSSIAVGDPLREVKWKPSIFMPRRYSRLTLYVTDVRVERLQDISEEDARAEGTKEPSLRQFHSSLAQAAWSERSVYARLWNAINGPGAWDQNPYVAAYTFSVRTGNVDTLPSNLSEAA